MMIRIYIFIFFIIFSNVFSQVGIGTTNPQAALEVRSRTDGLLIPRVALTATNVATIATPTVSELVYNTNTTVNGANRVSPGFYYWSGTTWIKLIASNQATNEWNINGNNATTSNFIGTTNDADLIFKRNNIYAGAIGQNNIALGINTMNVNSINDFRNVALGNNSLKLCNGCFDNVSFGYSTLENTISSSSNTAVGSFSMQNNTTGYQNCTLGAATLIANTIGYRNIAIGNAALNTNTTGNSNIAIGGQALQLNTTGNINTSIGERSMFSATTATLNVAMGFRALSNTTSGSRNTAIGSQAMLSNSIGNNNTAVGYNAMVLSTGTNNTAIGYNTTIPINSASNQVRIGNNTVTYAGAQVAWSVTSDRRWKEDIKKSNLGLDFINQLNPVSYIRKSEDTEITKQKREYGFIAQELEQTLNSNNANNNGIITKDDEGMLSVRYNDLLAPMVKAIQELEEKNTKQEKTIQELLERLEKLERK